tara:strand:- start:3270 stop:3476 length:207 start_codon:yes stop_codon:yes gene_type:complete
MNYDYLRIIKPNIKKLKIGDLVKYKTEGKVCYGFFLRSVNDKEIEITSILNSLDAGEISKVKLMDLQR